MYHGKVSVLHLNTLSLIAVHIIVSIVTEIEGEEDDEEDGPERKRARLTDEEQSESTEIDVDSMLQKVGAISLCVQL